MLLLVLDLKKKSILFLFYLFIDFYLKWIPKNASLKWELCGEHPLASRWFWGQAKEHGDAHTQQEGVFI